MLSLCTLPPTLISNARQQHLTIPDRQNDNFRIISLYFVHFVFALLFKVGMLTGLDIIPCILRLTTTTTLSSTIENSKEENAKQKQLMVSAFLLCSLCYILTHRIRKHSLRCIVVLLITCQLLLVRDLLK